MTLGLSHRLNLPRHVEIGAGDEASEEESKKSYFLQSDYRAKRADQEERETNVFI
jgi:hypothetical protein